MITAVLGLLGALVYGSADFLGGLASRRISPLRVTAIGAVTGLAALLVALPFFGGVWSAAAIGWGVLSGVTGAIAISLLYACLAIGPMSILSPLTALISAIVPTTWGLLGGETFEPSGYVAIGIALVAVVLVGFVPEKGAVRPSLRGILMAIGSGAMIGAFLIIIDQTPDDSGLVPLVFNRGVNGAIMFAVVGVLAFVARRRGTTSQTPGWRPGLMLAVACGLVDTAANILLLVGIRLGDLTVMSVLTALYPAGTILLAAIVLKERVAPVQRVGLALAVSAAGMLAIA
ncbi:DMT family transporter [Leifsonia poae]|uniref:EamA domain-containing protein n=1 Tax=Leifsonia poae TaxID=110933 RepID=A0A9W6H7K5_9MICO|nr:DMT family transporter [Leifsonia poae]GLJ75426.1 hypothetical protein GCM10017584_10000 [Leifsonia poae]